MGWLHRQQDGSFGNIDVEIGRDALYRPNGW